MDHVFPHVPVRQWVLSLLIPLRVLLGTHPELVTPVQQVVRRVPTRHLLELPGMTAGQVRHEALPRRSEIVHRLNDNQGGPVEV